MARTLDRLQREQTKRRLFQEDVLSGLRQPRKQIPCRYFYDERGSRLFDEICELEEYYLTRTEMEIMEQHAWEMGQQIGSGVRLVELGSGSSLKTRILLEQLPDPVAYVPVDISCKHLHRTAEALAEAYPQWEVLPVCADFRWEFPLPAPIREPTHTAVYFPGSTIGNFLPSEASELLERIATMCGPGGGLLIGVDLKKEISLLERAYNDSAGVTAEFNLNLLHRMQRELGARLNVAAFAHHAFYNSRAGRVEIYIRSEEKQTIRIAGEVFSLEAGELIHTEYSHKYTIEEFAQLAKQAGLTLRKSWTDPRNYFAVLHLVVMD